MTKLSILLVTYNHDSYIKEAIESILIQKFDFPYEIIVADDCSTDKTINILESYAEKNPEIFKFLSAENNLGITKNYKRGFKACQGEYVAVLEGDDYWTSPSRIKKMVRFLDNNRGCVLAFNRFIVKEVKNKRFNIQPWPINEKFQLIYVTDLVRDNFIGNFSTCIYRKSAIDSLDDSLYEMKVYDWMFNIMIAQHGLIGYIPDVMSVYRLHPSGTWTQKSSEEKILDTVKSIDEYNKYLNYDYDSEFTEHKNRILTQLSPPPIVNLTKKQIIKAKIKVYCPPVILSVIKIFLPPKIINFFKE